MLSYTHFPGVEKVELCGFTVVLSKKVPNKFNVPHIQSYNETAEFHLFNRGRGAKV
jgi:hypothetical protein